MRLRADGWYKADEGNHFVLTEKGKVNSASYRDMTVGEPVDEYDYEAVGWAVDEGYLIEVPIPDWIEKEGYEVVYTIRKDGKEYTLPLGNPCVYPEIELAEKYISNYVKPWFDYTPYIRKATFRGRALKECRMYNEKKVYNMSWYYGTGCLAIGDYVEEDIVYKLMNMLPPKSMKRACMQVGEPADHRDKNGVCRPTYATFKEVGDGVFEYCGDCFAGENVRY